MIYLYNNRIDNNDNNNNNDIIEYIEFENGNIGINDIDIFEDLYLISFLPLKIIISLRY
jgi:hypothetical protein